MFRSIRWRITIPYVLLVLISVIGLGMYLSRFVRNNHLYELENSLASQAKLLADSISRQSLDLDKIDKNIQELTTDWSNLLGARITIIGIDGWVLGDSEEDYSTMDNHINRPEVYEALTQGYGQSIRTSATLGYEMMYVASPITMNGDAVGIIRLALPTEQINQNIIQLRRNILFTSLFAAFLTILFSTIIVHLTASPLVKLTQSINKMVDEDHIHSSTMIEYDEVKQLGSAFNTLVNQLKNQIHALRTEQSKLSNILKQMTDGVIITDENGIIKLINPKAKTLFDIDTKAIEETTLIHAIRNHQIVEAWELCIKTGQEQAISLEMPIKNKFIQCVIISLSSDLPRQYLLLFQDLTRMHRLETVRRDFISNISHELRTPLASLKALTETLQDGAIDDPPAAQKFLKRMETEVDALAQMVSELLELTRIESGQVPLEKKSIDPCYLMNSAVERLGVQADRAGIEISINCQQDLPEIFADPPRLGQAIVNLLHNAIKFTPAGGKINLSTFREKGDMVFVIEDSGVGIPDTDLSRIFERFYKADRARSGGGTGLGLAITKHMVEAHGGKLWVESIEGQGSTFTFSIPIET